MLSICIPVYNFDVRELVASLHRQAKKTGIPFEILLADDFSDEQFRTFNQECMQFDGVNIVQQQQNQGRSRTRNLLARQAKYPWLLFLDCDSSCSDDKFIERYLLHKESNSVICGGTIYPTEPPAPEKYLHWYFGTHREAVPALKRQKNPDHSFTTHNFMAPSWVFEKIQFHDQLMGYGHEDTLFGLDLADYNIKVVHIENPLFHDGLQNTQVFLIKSREATQSLLKVLKITKNKKGLRKKVKLLRARHLLTQTGTCKLFGWIYRFLEPLIIRNLTGKKPSLFFLDLFKLGNICLIPARSDTQ